MKNISQVVYVIQNLELEIIKIGISYDVNNRLLNLISSSGCKLEIKSSTYGLVNAKEIESILHEYFKEHRKIGEWFNMKPDEAIKKMHELERSIGVYDSLMLRYVNGESISSLARSERCSRQNIIQKLKKLGIHNNPDIIEIKALNIDNIIEENMITSCLDMDLEENKNLFNNSVFRNVDKNISTDGKYFQLKKWKNGKFEISYFYNIESAVKCRDFLN